MVLPRAHIIEGSSRIVGTDIASKNKLKIIEISVDSISQCPIINPQSKQTDTNKQGGTL